MNICEKHSFIIKKSQNSAHLHISLLYRYSNYPFITGNLESANTCGASRRHV